MYKLQHAKGSRYNRLYKTRSHQNTQYKRALLIIIERLVFRTTYRELSEMIGVSLERCRQLHYRINRKLLREEFIWTFPRNFLENMALRHETTVQHIVGVLNDKGYVM